MITWMPRSESWQKLLLAMFMLMLKTETVLPKQNITFPHSSAGYKLPNRIVSDLNAIVFMYSGVKSKPKIRCQVH